MLAYADRYLPQQPLLPCLLPSAKTYNTLRTTTNPYEVTLSVKTPAAAATAAAGKGKAAVSAAPGVVVLGTSGQNVEDILKYSTLDGSLDILERLLEWRHLAPTGGVRPRNTLVA
jgi:DNA polymerase delta subunit 2